MSDPQHPMKLYGPLTAEQAAQAQNGKYGEHIVRQVAMDRPLSAAELSFIRDQFCGLKGYEDPPTLTEDRLREQDARLQEWITETDRANRWYGEHHRDE